ncbi:GNAT family N-acetyltransferase [Vibrio splendidus]|uniref:GNAT family N-acetyltransferase n=1 Tax=Vibrio splendidus TaxID=29497 RepID=UPI00021C2404|nr:GNAT family N-acetyltransferase [Vibrio splendidus]EGU40957.1 GCN5-like N-acetyltransferase [Vibrio splendidus ATCC 33789]
MLETARTQIEAMGKQHAAVLLQYHLENRCHLAPWSPMRDEQFYTLEYWEDFCHASEALFESGKEIKFVAIDKETREVVGVCSYTAIARGVFQACFLGYHMAQKYEGKGFMTEILEVTLRYMFDVVGLNRIMATYMPRNKASEKVLFKLGFEKEGYARKYLKIAGKWEDHILTSRISDN